jgi:dTDP-4-amino-4,6-dideoxygalactose transaminase
MDRFDESELEAVKEVIRSGELSRFFTDFSGGRYVQAFEEDFAKYLGVEHAISVCNGTVSLEIALQAMGIKRGQEVITTPLSFIATGTAILRVGAKPVFVDIDKSTLNIDADLIENAITRRTRAIITVSLNGMPCSMYVVNSIARKHNLMVLEDAAQSLGASIDGQKIGTYGLCGCFSFQESKTITTLGEGGMIVTNDFCIAEKARNIRNHGNVYGTMDDVVCTNARMTEAQAAFGCMQLRKLDSFNEVSKRNAEYFLSHLKPPFASVWNMTDEPAAKLLRKSYRSSYYLMPVVASPDVRRDHFVQYTKDCGLSKGAPGQNVGYYKRLIYENKIFQSNPKGRLPDCPNAEWAQKNVYLFDIHRWNKTKKDMCEALKLLNMYKP